MKDFKRKRESQDHTVSNSESVKNGSMEVFPFQLLVDNSARVSQEREKLVKIKTSIASVSTSRTVPMQRAFVKVVGGDPEEGEDILIVNDILFADRVPTSVSGGQGAHTVAEALIETSITAALSGKNLAQALFALKLMALQTLTGKITKPKGQQYKTVEELVGEIDNFRDAISRGEVKPFKSQSDLESLIEAYWRLASKRALTALPHTDETVGIGGKEKTGKSGINEIKEEVFELGQENLNEEFFHQVIDAASTSTVELIDFLPQSEGDIESLAVVLHRAIEHVIYALDEEQFGQYYEAMPGPIVEAYLKRLYSSYDQSQNLDDKKLGERIENSIVLTNNYKHAIIGNIESMLFPEYSDTYENVRNDDKMEMSEDDDF